MQDFVAAQGGKLTPWFRLILENGLDEWWQHLEEGKDLNAISDWENIIRFS